MKKYFAVFLLIIAAFFIGKSLAQPSPCVANCGSQLITVTASDFKSKLSEQNYVLIDIRTEDEFKEAHLANAINQDFYQTQNFQTYLESLDKTKPYAIYCRSGNRSGQALKMMEELGFTRVINLDGGIQSWQSVGFPVIN